MKNTLGVLAIVAFLGWTATHALAQPVSNAVRVDELFAPWNRKDSPGCVVLVRQDGKTLHERAYGMAHLELGVPLSLSSVFLLASVSKQFVVFLIMLLAQNGRLSLDDDVRKHVPELPDFGKKITIRQLIHHTSGLREDLTSFSLAGWRTGDAITRDDFLRFVKNQKGLNFEPGAEYLYCNTGYHLLAIIVERTTKQSMAEYASEQIFQPLGMKSTVVRDAHRKLIPNLAACYAPRGDLSSKDTSDFLLARVAHDPPGASNVHSTVHDLALWDQNFYDATVGGRKLIDDMQIPAKLTSGKPSKYAGGLFVDRYRGLKTVSHTGFHGGYKTVILRFPEQRFSVIVLANVRDFVPIRMAKRIADIYLADKLELAKERSAAKEAGDVESLLGEYRFGQSLWRVARDAKGQPFVQVDGGEKKRLFLASDGEFFDREDGTTYRFTTKKGDIELETLAETTRQTGKRIRLIEPPVEKLAAYVGVYRSGELNTFSSIEKRGPRLYLVTPKSEALLQFLEGGECIARPRDAFFSMLTIQFTHDRDSAVTGYNISTERVRNLRFAKVKID
jgi:CubicO group peptidase (beta-lactamase class C family)